MEERIPGYCALCISRCGCISVVKDGVLQSVEPFPQHPTGKSLCIKGKSAPEMVYSPERILTPLKRTHSKDSDDPGWQAISWDEALDTITTKL
jgi:anaerobic selenocysteine-containing dehydrogenase